MKPEGGTGGQALRAMLAFLALGVTVSIIYGLFSSGFGRLHRTPVGAPPPVQAPPAPTQPPPAAPGRAGPVRGRTVTAAMAAPRIAVVAHDFWLTYLPAGFDRDDGGVIEPDQGAWARFTPKAGLGTTRPQGGFVEVRVEHGAAAADWATYQRRTPLRTPRETTIRGRPALVGRRPGGGLMIVWLERTGTGASIRVSESLSEELLRVAASVKGPVGD